MPQRFSKNDEDETKFLAVWEALMADTFQDLQDFFENVNQSRELGTALYDAQVVDVWKILERNFFINIFDKLVSSGYTAGAIDTYCRVIYALFGDTAEIVVENENPMEITIGVVAEYLGLADWFSAGGAWMSGGDFDIAFRTFLNDIPTSQMNSLLRAITNAGTKVNFNLN